MTEQESKHILVVEDDPNIRAMIVAALDFEGYTIETAANGREALAVVERTPPALVLLDMRMPILDGWGFARELETRGIALPIMVVSAAQDAQQWAAEIGAAACVAKPFKINDLLDQVETLLQAEHAG